MSYIEGEVFTFEKEKKSTIAMSDEDINAKYKRGEIRIVTEQARYPVKSIKGMLDGEDYKLDPEYQRRKRWDNGRKSRLIESFIMNVPLPPIFLYEYDYSKFEVMDGLQRLTSIYDFYSENFPLEGLEYWKELEGKTYSELPREIQRGIDRRYISSIVLLEETAKSKEEAEELKQIVFERLNSGGEKLTPQETRNALYNGKFNQLCIKLSNNEKFRDMWDIPLERSKRSTSEVYRKMEDVELVLRFFAYRFLDKFTGSIEDFLDAYLKQANKFPDETIGQLETLFVDSIEAAYLIFGKDAFISPTYDRKVTKPQKTVYDPLMQAIALNIEKKNIMISNSEKIKEERYDENEMYIDNDKNKRLFDGRKTQVTAVQERIKYFDNLLKKHSLG